MIRRRTMRKACFLILSFLLFGPALLATNSHPALSLEQCIAIALKRNPDIAAAQALVAAAKANMKVAHAGYLPVVHPPDVQLHGEPWNASGRLEALLQRAIECQRALLLRRAESFAKLIGFWPHKGSH